MTNTNTNNTTAATTTTTAIELIKFIERVGIDNIYSGGRCDACPFTGQECEELSGGGCFDNTPIYYDERGEEQKLPSFIMEGSELIKLPMLYNNPPVMVDKMYNVSIHADHGVEEDSESEEYYRYDRYELSYEEV